MRVPFVDLHAQYAVIRDEIDAAMAAVIRESAFIGGPYVKAFEGEFAAYCGTKYAVGVSNGTDALRLALLACGVGPGLEVITVPNTFVATTEAISMVGAGVRFVDVDPVTYNLDPARLAAAVTPYTRAVIPVHLFGQPADMDPILEVARHHRLKVIGDAAQAHGALYKGRKVGTLGDVACFSFYPAKNLGAYGDAGAVVTDDPDIARRVAMLCDHGRTTKYEHELEGFNCRLDGLQAAILSVKLRHLDGWNEARRRHADRYNRLLAGVPAVQTPRVRDDIRAVFHLYVVQLDDRERVQKSLQEKGVSTGIHYPIPLHLQKAYARLRLDPGSFPAAERLASRLLSLPMYPELTEEQARYVAAQLCEALAPAQAVWS